MGKCLITKLNGSVQNNSLLRIGEFTVKVSKIESPTADSQKFSINNTKDSQLRIIGDGYFTNETLTENKGKVMNISANTETLVYYSNGDYEIAVSEKYSLYFIGIFLSTNWKDFKGKLSFDIESLKYSSNITRLFLANTQVTGDIAVFGRLTNLTEIPSVNNTKVTGDISIYRNTRSSQLRFTGTSVYGDLSVLPNDVLWVQGRNTGTFTWTGIKNRTNILALELCKCDNIDAFLNDMATLEAKFASEQIWHKKISLIGTRTSASDAAVQILQQKGYTVSVTPE